MTLRNPTIALDYPSFRDDNLYVIWSGNEHRWPDARRSTSYLTEIARHALTGHAVFSQNWRDAKHFQSAGAAATWLLAEEAKRGHPYQVNITTVHELKAARGYLIEEAA